MNKNVTLRYGNARGIGKNHKGFPQAENLTVFGADTETVHGEPHTLQIVGPDDEMIERVTPETILPVFMKWILQRSYEHRSNIVWFHNLNFDLRILFKTYQREIYEQFNDVHLKGPGWTAQMLFGKVNTCKIWEDHGGYVCKKHGEIPNARKEKGRTLCGNPRCALRAKRNLGACIRLLDSSAFCPAGGKSLDAALKIYGVPYTKLKAPHSKDCPREKDNCCLGDKPLWDPEFIEYALNDARAERALGLEILKMQKEYDVTPSISLPQFAGRVLRHHFFKPNEVIQFPTNTHCRFASELSYHAGKNGIYARRGVYENIYEYDINSAFPKAMRELPQMIRGDYVRTSTYRPKLMGVYKVHGLAKNPRYPIVFDYLFRRVDGKFQDTWITGFEVEALKESPDYTDWSVDEGWVWEPDKRYKHSPLREFVDNFWKLKAKAPKGPKRDQYKLILNSLYGKFASCVEVRKVIDTAFGPLQISEPSKTWIAGSLYNPFIASQITGFVRRELWRLETKGEAIHSATDAIKTALLLHTSKKLGGLKEEVYGRCYLFRTKLYLHFAVDNSRCEHDLTGGWIKVRGEMRRVFDKDGQHLCKYALHGFKGNVLDLFKHRYKLMREGELSYTYSHMVGLREGFKRGEKVADFIERREKLVLAGGN